MESLSGKKIVLGVTGGIAAYKAVEVASRLRKAGAEVHVIMTREATEFVTELTFREISGQPSGDTASARGRGKIRRSSKMILAIPAPLSCRPCETTRPMDEISEQMRTQSNSSLDRGACAATRRATGGRLRKHQ